MSTGQILQESEILIIGDTPFSGFQIDAFNNLPTLEVLEDQYIRYVMDYCNGKREDASAILGINRKTLYRKLVNNDVNYDVSNIDPSDL